MTSQWCKNNPLLRQTHIPKSVTTYLTNGRYRQTMLPKVFYDDYNRPTRNCIVDVEERPALGELILLRDFDGDFQSECVVINIKTIDAGGGRVVTKTGRVLRDSGPQLFVELKQVSPIEYLDHS